MLKSELDVLKFWEDGQIFQKSLEKTKNAAPYKFLEGPPFGTGMPHWGHISTSFIKDTFARYHTQKGDYCFRPWGWDCHGLPVESMIQKKFGVFDKRKIENEIGIDKFNKVCRNSILEFDQAWRNTITRAGRWVDWDNQYRTMDNEYIESVWWGLGQLWNKNLLKKDYRVSLYSHTMGASLSHLEMSDDVKYGEETVLSPIVKFKVDEISAKRLFRKIEEEVSYQYSTQISLKNDIERRLIEIQNLGKIGKKANRAEVMKEKIVYEQINWKNFKTSEELDEEVDNLKSQLHTVLENIDLLNSLKSVLIKEFPVSLLVWTTTPWTLPANVAIVCNPELEYSMYYLESRGEILILAEKRAVATISVPLGESLLSPELESELEGVDTGEYFEKLGLKITKIASFMGKDLEGIEYRPLFENNQEIESFEQKSNMYKIYTADFVSDSDGTGLVHIAPGYGAEDYEVGRQRNLPVIYSLNSFGEVRSDLDELLKPAFSKIFYEANDIITGIIDKREQLFAVLKYTHKVPIYSRDDSKLYYMAKENYYITETRFLDRSLELNESISWSPNHLKHGRFKIGLQSAPDWCISRDRFWGSPLPIWQTEDGSKSMFIDSLEKLEKYSLNPIYKILNSRDIDYNEYEKGKTVILTDIQSKLPLGINAAQFRSRSLTELRREARVDIHVFAEYGQRILDEIMELFEKYQTVQLMLEEGEKRLFTTWIYTLDKNSQKISQKFYFYKKMEIDEFGEWTSASGIKFLDLHRPYIDEIVLKDEVGNIYNRIKDVVDCWVESGSMPFASWHYPFENRDVVEKSIPGDYVVEYVGQIRGWFHAMHILSTAIFDKPPFLNVHAHGTVLGNDGKKLSKSKKNYDSTPEELLEKVGSDAVRTWFYLGPYFSAEDAILKDEDAVAICRDTTILLSNIQTFADYAIGLTKNLDRRGDRIEVYDPILLSQIKPAHSLNKWWIAKTQLYCSQISIYMDEYKITEAAKLMMEYIQDLSTWYIRRVKDLLDTHRLESVEVLRTTLRFFSVYSASILPFCTERLWSVIREVNHNFGDPESVHLTTLTTTKIELTQKQQSLLKDMEVLRELCSQILAVRKDKKLRVRQPLYADLSKVNFESSLIETLTLECNLISKSLDNLEGEIFEASGEFGSIKVDLVVGAELAVLGFGRDTERQIQNWRKKQGFKPGEVISIFWALEKTDNRDIYEEVIRAMDWEKLNLEVKFVNLDELGDGSESLEIKEFAKIKLKTNPN